MIKLYNYYPLFYIAIEGFIVSTGLVIILYYVTQATKRNIPSVPNVERSWVMQKKNPKQTNELHQSVTVIIKKHFGCEHTAYDSYLGNG